jgi:hypothetical protein
VHEFVKQAASACKNGVKLQIVIYEVKSTKKNYYASDDGYEKPSGAENQFPGYGKLKPLLDFPATLNLTSDPLLPLNAHTATRLDNVRFQSPLTPMSHMVRKRNCSITEDEWRDLYVETVSSYGE